MPLLLSPEATGWMVGSVVGLLFLAMIFAVVLVLSR
jgi:hypothetical protein